MNSYNTAILFFSRTAKTEAKAKPLAVGKRASECIAAYSIDTIKKIALQTKLPVFFISEQKQRGESFGERFANAFDDVFHKGFEQVIAIGNDCLAITTHDIVSAAESLQNSASVLGATKDGGVYLIGMQQIAFHKQAFQNIHWQSDITFSQLLTHFTNQKIYPFFIDEKTDIDRISDWATILQTLPDLIKKQLLRLFDIGKKILPTFFHTSISDQSQIPFQCLRAPPLGF